MGSWLLWLPRGCPFFLLLLLYGGRLKSFRPKLSMRKHFPNLSLFQNWKHSKNVLETALLQSAEGGGQCECVTVSLWDIRILPRYWIKRKAREASPKRSNLWRGGVLERDSNVINIVRCSCSGTNRVYKCNTRCRKPTTFGKIFVLNFTKELLTNLFPSSFEQSTSWYLLLMYALNCI